MRHRVKAHRKADGGAVYGALVMSEGSSPFWPHPPTY